MSSAIAVDGLSKRFGAVTAVDGLSFEAHAGRVTGFLGRNGAGKTTTLYALLGLVTPDSGTAHVAGRPYRELDEPLGRVGAVLESSTFHPSRTGRGHLRALAFAVDLPRSGVQRAIELTGLQAVADRAVRSYSLGMRRRLGLAVAMLGDPQVLILDEPFNGLDPQGIRWLRELLADLAAEGRCVLMSSHVLSEIDRLVDDVVIIEAGRLIRQGSVAELTGAGRSLEDTFIELTGSAPGVLG